MKSFFNRFVPKEKESEFDHLKTKFIKDLANLICKINMLQKEEDPNRKEKADILKKYYEEPYKLLRAYFLEKNSFNANQDRQKIREIMGKCIAITISLEDKKILNQQDAPKEKAAYIGGMSALALSVTTLVGVMTGPLGALVVGMATASYLGAADPQFTLKTETAQLIENLSIAATGLKDFFDAASFAPTSIEMKDLTPAAGPKP